MYIAMPGDVAASFRVRIPRPSKTFTLKDTYSTAAKRGSVFIGLMTPNCAIWPRYQRAVLMK